MAGGVQEWVILGKISGLFGVQGWVKVYSDTSPRKNILQYPVWYLGENGKAYPLKQGKVHGKGIIAQLQDITDRDQAARLLGSMIRVPRSVLPEPGEDEFYWSDLEGLEVYTTEGVILGRVDYLFETGANDVMVIKGDHQRLLPFVNEVIKGVDLAAGTITVDWDPEF